MFSISAGISAEAQGARAFVYHSRGHPQGLPASGGHFREHFFGIPVGILAGTGKRAGISAGIFGACWRALPGGAKCRGGFRTTIFLGRREAARHGGGFFLLWLGLGPCAPPPTIVVCVFGDNISLALVESGRKAAPGPSCRAAFQGERRLRPRALSTRTSGLCVCLVPVLRLGRGGARAEDGMPIAQALADPYSASPRKTRPSGNKGRESRWLYRGSDEKGPT